VISDEAAFGLTSTLIFTPSLCASRKDRLASAPLLADFDSEEAGLLTEECFDLLDCFDLDEAWSVGAAQCECEPEVLLLSSRPGAADLLAEGYGLRDEAVLGSTREPAGAESAHFESLAPE